MGINQIELNVKIMKFIKILSICSLNLEKNEHGNAYQTMYATDCKCFKSNFVRTIGCRVLDWTRTTLGGVGRILESYANCLEFSQPPSCLDEAM